MSSSDVAALFTSGKLGRVEPAHRIVLAPLTRNRADDLHTHTSVGVDYYTQRSAEPGTFLITEATYIHPKAAGFPNTPAISSSEQIAAWKKVRVLFHLVSTVIDCALDHRRGTREWVLHLCPAVGHWPIRNG